MAPIPPLARYYKSRDMHSLLGFGHSHIVAVAKGCYDLQHMGLSFADAPLAAEFYYLYDPEFTPALIVGAEGRNLHPHIVEKIEQVDPLCILLSIGGNEHNALSVVQLYRRFDFILSERPDLPLEPGADVLPEAVVAETLRERMENTLATIRAFREATRLPIALLEPPPPLPTEQVLAYPKEFFRAAVDHRKLSTEALRHKMWRVQASLYRELCDRLGVVYVPVPAELTDDRGMLAKAAWGQDATHANALFGRRMIEELMSRMSETLRSNGR